MKIRKPFQFGLIPMGLMTSLVCVLLQASAKADPPAAPGTQTVVRRVVMKDARSATQFADQLKTIEATGVFGGNPAPNAQKPAFGDLAFLTSGNYLLITGEKDRIDKYIGDIDLMAFLFERPRAHLQLNARVVQLTGPANTDVIQMTETVRALVDAQRTEVVRAFADLQDYLLARLKRRKGADLQVYQEIRRILPTLGDGDRPLTVPEILLLLMVDRVLPDLPLAAPTSSGSEADQALLEFQKSLTTALQDPHESDEQIAHDIGGKLAPWERAVSDARAWCADSERGMGNTNGSTVDDLLSALRDPRCPLPTWVALHLRRSVELTQRLYPALCRKQAQESLDELQRRFQSALDREHSIQASITALEAPAKSDKNNPRLPGDLRRRLFDLQSVANDLVSVPMALFQSVAAAADDASPGLNQLISMFHDYADERAKLEQSLRSDDPAKLPPVNYAKLEMLEASLNLWLRRGSDALSRTLEQQFYNHYVEQLRLLANRQLDKLSSHDILSSSNIANVPDVVQDVLLSDSTVNLFLSNSVSLQFEPDTTGSVSAQVATRLPSQTALIDRVNQAAQASAALGQMAQITQSPATATTTPSVLPPSPLTQLSQQYGFDGADVIRALLAGGQAVSVQSGINLIANPSIGFDSSTITLTLTVNETLQPNTDNITDRVTNHNINDATVTALAYEPTVLSTLTSNLSYYQTTGGFPVLRQIPGVKDLLKDVPIAPFQEGKRKKGVYQSSLIILEPVVIPTIEDLVRYYSGYRS